MTRVYPSLTAHFSSPVSLRARPITGCFIQAHSSRNTILFHTAVFRIILRYDDFCFVRWIFEDRNAHV